MSGPARSAVIDLGSNSVRMMVVEAERDGAWRVLDEERAILRLGDALARKGALAEDLARAQYVFAALVARARGLGAERIVAVGTAALRSARDGAAFSAALGRAAHLQIRILDGIEEAELGFLGAMHTLDVRDGNLVDVGGASSEISYFATRRLRLAASATVGAVTLTRNALHQDPPSKSELEAARAAAAEAIRVAMPEPRRGLPLVALGGSFRSIAKMHIAQTAYSFPSLHNYHMPPAAIADLEQRIVRLALRQRLLVPGLAAHRAETAVAALTLAQALCNHLQPSEIIVSGSGLREGMLFERILPGGEEIPEDVFGPSIRNLLFQLGEEPDRDLIAWADELFTALGPLLPQQEAPRLGRAAAQLRGIGRRVNFYDRHRHTFTLVTSARVFGLSHREQLVLAASAAYEGPRRTRDLLVAYGPLVDRGDVLLAQRIGLTVAYAEAMARQTPSARPRISATIEPSRIELRINGAPKPPDIPFDEAARLAGQFGKAFGRKLVVRYTEDQQSV
ncbi:MAG: Ppx/GppA phosphatase family protein [Thermaerobacter sp.]|nr:Ppx/GppA phosphatase family protein [Thermaerobacter sp.]